jgi:hypothetical protein
MKVLVLLLLTITGCSAAKPAPPAQTKWSRLFNIEKSSTTGKVPPRLRDRMVTRANALLEARADADGYGEQDLGSVFQNLELNLSWSADKGTSALVTLARKHGAYHTDTDPRPGDIVLFHNQLDVNGNGKMDDWLTGCGIVTSLSGGKFRAVVRTGHALKQVVVWPDGPSRRKINGKKTNYFLRVPTRADSSDTEYLAGQLYAGYIDIVQFTAGESR